VPRKMTTRSSGWCDCRQGSRYSRPFLYGSSGLSSTVVRPLNPSSITRYSEPSSACSTPVQRTSRGKRRPSLPGTKPQVFESP